MIKEEQSRRKEAEIQGLTFKPQTNTSSYPARNRTVKTEDSLIDFGIRSKEKLKFLQMQKSEQERLEFDFHPKILQKSEQMVRRKMDSRPQSVGSNASVGANSEKRMTKFDHLYEDAKRRKQRKTQIYERCIHKDYTFHPNTTHPKIRSGSRQSEKSESKRSAIFEKLSQGGNSTQERSQICMANS